MEGLLIKNIIDLLRKNKEFPNYQAERRIDIFINHFLERILSEYLQTPIQFACPEFPLKKPEIEGSQKSKNQSTKLDYLCYSSDQVYYVELKTDSHSIKPEQLKIYFDNSIWNSCLCNFDTLVNGPKRKSDYQSKYKLLQEQIGHLRSDRFNKRARIIYLSPLSKEQTNNIGPYKIRKLTPFSELNLVLTESEKVVWEFLADIKMNVFEVVSDQNEYSLNT